MLEYVFEFSKLFLVVVIFLLLNLILFYAILKLNTVIIKKLSKNKYLLADRKKASLIVGFFHPFCDSGGGGERVLWSAVKCIQDKLVNREILKSFLKRITFNFKSQDIQTAFVLFILGTRQHLKISSKMPMNDSLLN